MVLDVVVDDLGLVPRSQDDLLDVGGNEVEDVVEHRLAREGDELLRHRVGDRAEAGPEPPDQDERLHGGREFPALLMSAVRPRRERGIDGIGPFQGLTRGSRF